MSSPSTIQLRDYQETGVQSIVSAWAAGAHNILYQLPCRGGKTPVLSSVIRQEPGCSIFIAHRIELLEQCSLTLARNGIRHRIIGSTATVRQIAAAHADAFGTIFIDPAARCGVASVDSITLRDLGDWAARVALWVTDECHHLLRSNKWGKAIALFPNARGLGVTATAGRPDGRGLGRHADGVFDVLIQGPEPRELINREFIADYTYYAPKSDIDFTALPVSDATGDFVQAPLVEATGRSKVVGDVVSHYRRFCPGARAVVFAPSVESCSEIAVKFRAAGIPTEAVSAKTPNRSVFLQRFRRREILVLVNVGLFDEGLDVPEMDACIMCAATHSLTRYIQATFRCLTWKGDGRKGIILDLVENIWRNGGPPDLPRRWSLDRRERRAKRDSDEVKLIRACPACTAVYERFLRACPHCGHTPEPVSRTAPEHVEGDLFELDLAVLTRLHEQAAAILGPPKIPHGAGPPVVGRLQRLHRERVDAQVRLRDRLAWWGGLQNALGRDDREGYRRFFLEHGVDVLTARTLGTKEAEAMIARIDADLAAHGVQYE